MPAQHTALTWQGEEGLSHCEQYYSLTKHYLPATATQAEAKKGCTSLGESSFFPVVKKVSNMDTNLIELYIHIVASLKFIFFLCSEL